MHTITHEIMTYSPFDLLTIFTLILLEGLLSVDNALVLAALVKKLPGPQQRRALTYGVFGAIFFRVLAVILATHLMKITFVKLIGGAYLIFLAFKHLFPASQVLTSGSPGESAKPVKPHSFWTTVILVELTDIVFSIDSITTAVAMSSKISVIIIGGIAGILAMRFVAMVFIKLLEKYPRLDDIAYQLIFFIGIKLCLECFHYEIDEKTFWLVMAFIVLVGVSLLYRENLSLSKNTSYLITANSEDFIIQINRNHLSVEELFESTNQFSADFLRYLIKNGYLEYTRKATLSKVKKVNMDLYKSAEAKTDKPDGDSAEPPGQAHTS